jgi:AraC-like DNA-binding protein
MTRKELAEVALEMVVTADIEDLANLTVTVIARRMGVSLPNLSRAFRKHFGETLVIFLRFEKYAAFESLMKKDITLTSNKALEILDIRSHSNFCKRYKEFRGCSPGKYTELIRDSKSPEKEIALD